MGRVGWRAARAAVRPWRWYAAILVPLVLAHMVFGIVAGRQLSRELAKVKASGAPLTTAELAPPAVPDEENAALVYQRAFEIAMRLSESNIPFERVKDFWKRAVQDPDIAGWRGIAVGEPPYGPEPATASEVEEFLRRHHRKLELLRLGATMPKARYPVDWSEVRSAFFPHLSTMRVSAQLLGASALVRSRRGDAEGAVADVEAILAMADSVAPEPALISQVARVASQRVAIYTLNTVMCTSAPSASECRRLHAALSRVDQMAAFQRAMEGSRVLGIWVFDEIRRSPETYSSLFGPTSSCDRILLPEPPEWLMRTGLVRVLWSPWLKKDEVLYLRYVERKLALFQKPHDEKSREELERWLSQMPQYALVTRVLVPMFGRAAQRRDEGIANVGLAQWALALRVYQAKTGRYPAALGDVATVVDWPLPGDPFSGRPFVYGREGQGYFLYSLGPNRRDDGGKERPRTYAPAETAPDDIVWRMTR
jgi:hypothetical protein